MPKDIVATRSAAAGPLRAACPCGYVIDILHLTHLSVCCDECLGQFSVEGGIRRYEEASHRGDLQERFGCLIVRYRAPSPV